MSESNDTRRSVVKLRRQAEDILEMTEAEREEHYSPEVKTLLHELRVHQVELEIQNEELRDAQQVMENEKSKAEEVRDRFMRLFHEAPVGYAAVDSDGMIHAANQTLRQMASLDIDSPFGRSSFAALLQPEDEQVFRARFPAFFDHPSDKRLEARLRQEGGGEFWVEITGRPVAWRFNLTPGREVQTQLLLIISDIRRRKELEGELALAAKVFEHSTQGIMISNAGGEILKVNDAFTEFTGYPAAEVAGRSYQLLLSTERHAPEFMQRLWEQLLAAGTWQGEIRHRRQNGEIIPAWLHVYAVRNRSGRTTNFIYIVSHTAD